MSSRGGGLPPLLGPNAEAQRLLGRMPLAKLRAAAEAREIVVPRRATRAELANRLVLHSMHQRSEADYIETGNAFDSRASAYEPIARAVRRGRLRHIVDIGCGPGLFAAELRARGLPADARYVGIDTSAAAIELARTRLTGDARFTFDVGDAADTKGHLGAGVDGIVLGFVLTYLDTQTAHRLFATFAKACPQATVILAFTFRSSVDRREGVEPDEASELRAARRYLRGDRSAAAKVWETSRFEHYRRSFEQYYTIEREQILAPLVQILWVARPRSLRARRRVRTPRKPSRA